MVFYHDMRQVTFQTLLPLELFKKQKNAKIWTVTLQDVTKIRN